MSWCGVFSPIMNIFHSVVFLITIGGVMAQEEESPAGPTPCGGWPSSVQLGQNCYVYIQKKQTWAEAESVCRTLGGALAEVETYEQNQLMEKLIRDHKGGDTWLGGQDLIVEGRWFWATSGKEITGLSFEDWAPHRPNNVENQDCLELSLHSPSGWNDRDCETHNSFICQKHVNSMSVATTGVPVIG